MNSDLWNVKDLKAPSRNTYKVKNHCVDIHALKNITADGLSHLKNPKLNEEAALLSRCIYRIKQKFRSDKGLKAMEKMNRALLQYLNMEIPQTIETFHNMVPEKYTSGMYLPTLNMLNYLLVRIQGLSKLMLRVVESAEVAAQYLELRIKIAHLWKVAFVCFAAVSRIFVLSKNRVRFCCEFYSQLRPFLTQLENPGPKWLPDDYAFPENLKTWLNVQWLNEEETIVKKATIPQVPRIFQIVDSDSDVEFCGTSQNERSSDEEVVKPHSMLKSEDVGEPVEIIEINSSGRKRKRKRKNEVTKEKEMKETVEDIGKPVENTETNLCKTPKKLKRRKKNKTLEETENPMSKNEELEVINIDVSKNKLKKKQKRTNGTLENAESSPAKKKVKKTNSDRTENEKKLVGRIRTLGNLRHFAQNFESIYQKHQNYFQKMDKLQFKMLHSSIKKHALKAKKNKDNSKVSFCIEKVKEIVKARLL